MTNIKQKPNILTIMVIILLVVLILVIKRVGDESMKNQQEMIDRLNTHIEKFNNLIEE